MASYFTSAQHNGKVFDLAMLRPTQTIAGAVKDG